MTDTTIPRSVTVRELRRILHSPGGITVYITVHLGGDSLLLKPNKKDMLEQLSRWDDPDQELEYTSLEGKTLYIG